MRLLAHAARHPAWDGSTGPCYGYGLPRNVTFFGCAPKLLSQLLSGKQHGYRLTPPLAHHQQQLIG